MSAHEVTDKLITFLDDEAPDLVILNYANADMVGHTGVFEAAVKSAETLDDCLSTLIPKALEEEYRIVIIADHGNSDLMINDDGTPHTAHTMNPVPLIVIDPDRHITQLRSGKLADIAPTILDLMGLDKPEEMTGISLLN
jgi:2,3-bisphosphoglycerate-independent phosphoglycerate mutase